jgi:hypothetical protein
MLVFSPCFSQPVDAPAQLGAVGKGFVMLMDDHGNYFTQVVTLSPSEIQSIALARLQHRSDVPPLPYSSSSQCNNTPLFNQDGEVALGDIEMTSVERRLQVHIGDFHRQVQEFLPFWTTDPAIVSYRVERITCGSVPLFWNNPADGVLGRIQFPTWILGQECIGDELLLFLFLHEVAHLTESVQDDHFLADDWAARFGLPFHFGSDWTPSFAMDFLDKVGDQLVALNQALLGDDWRKPDADYATTACRVDHIKGRYAFNPDGSAVVTYPAGCLPGNGEDRIRPLEPPRDITCLCANAGLDCNADEGYIDSPYGRLRRAVCTLDARLALWKACLGPPGFCLLGPVPDLLNEHLITTPPNREMRRLITSLEQSNGRFNKLEQIMLDPSRRNSKR